jgi:hypothetical protein
VKASRLRLKETVKQTLGPPGPWQMVPIELSLDELEPLHDVLEEHIMEGALPILRSIANLEDSPEKIAEFKQLWGGSAYGIVGESNEDLLQFRDQLRRLWEIAEQHNLKNQKPTGKPSTPEEGWQEFSARVMAHAKGQPRNPAEESQRILKQWFSCPFTETSAWKISPAAGKIVALPLNFRAIAGRILIHNQRFLATCTNPNCQTRFFLKRRWDQIFCGEEGCLRYGNKLHNREFRVRKGKLAPVAKRQKKGR